MCTAFTKSYCSIILVFLDVPICSPCLYDISTCSMEHFLYVTIWQIAFDSIERASVFFEWTWYSLEAVGDKIETCAGSILTRRKPEDFWNKCTILLATKHKEETSLTWSIPRDVFFFYFLKSLWRSWGQSKGLNQHWDAKVVKPDIPPSLPVSRPTAI